MSTNPNRNQSVGIFIPCLNEEQTIGQVVKDFRSALPNASVVVVDNDSTDASISEAQSAGATVITEKRRGNGYVVQTIFQNLESEILVIVDGDDTYPAEKVHELINPVASGEADMVVGSRTMEQSESAFHPLNKIGNIFYRIVINSIFGTRLTDILSGYRCFSQRMVKSLPIFVTGFEVEAELTIKSLERGFRISETPVNLKPRPKGSHSKIRIVQDGMRILLTILALFRDYKPLTYFGSLGLTSIFLALIPGIRVLYTYFQESYVLDIPLTLLALSLAFVGILLIVIGLILHAINRRFQELEYYMHLMIDR
jgi:glycosyltransferase involved in cell wall biosynthesis